MVLVAWTASEPRAESELPYPTERLLRWPLTASEHPELAPRYDVAKELAEPGLDWLGLCELGAHKRTVPKLRDQTAYLAAWCAIANRDVDTGLAELTSLASSRLRGMPAAIRADIANVLASEGTAERARGLLARHRIVDVGVRDRLAAMFIDMNKLDDAAEINDLAIGFGEHVPNACERQARRIVMTPDRYRGPGLERKRLLRGRGAVCDELEREVTCWLDLGRCGEFFKTQGRSKLARVFDVHRTTPLETWRWSEAISDATKKLSSERDLSAVLDMLVRLRSECPDPNRMRLRDLINRIGYRDDLPPRIRLRIDYLRESDFVRCAP